MRRESFPPRSVGDALVSGDGALPEPVLPAEIDEFLVHLEKERDL